jgi:hypothetical protein
VTRVSPAPQRFVIGTFILLAAVAFAVAPLPLALRSVGILLASYLSFSVGGAPAAFTTALLAPAAGLITGSEEWLVMLPIVLASNLLAMIGLEFAWRYPALVVSPALLAIPPIFVLYMSRQELFSVHLPWEPSAGMWIALHALTALAGVLVAVYLDRRRERETAKA